MTNASHLDLYLAFLSISRSTDTPYTHYFELIYSKIFVWRVGKFEIIIHVGPSHYYNAKLKPSSVNFLYIIYSNLV
jgi:hypothetical protein